MKFVTAMLGAGLALVPLGCAAPPAAGPAQIIFLRHAEKPDTGNELNARGRERAAALVHLFLHDPQLREHGSPAAIFAMRPKGKKGSVRAIETMEPTARALQLTPDTRFTRDELGALKDAIMSAPLLAGKTVIVCWEHDAIPEMLQVFGWTSGPTRWPAKTYDRLWLLDFQDGKPVRFRNLPQKLLPGDSAS